MQSASEGSKTSQKTTHDSRIRFMDFLEVACARSVGLEVRGYWLTRMGASIPSKESKKCHDAVNFRGTAATG